MATIRSAGVALAVLLGLTACSDTYPVEIAPIPTPTADEDVTIAPAEAACMVRYLWVTPREDADHVLRTQPIAISWRGTVNDAEMAVSGPTGMVYGSTYVDAEQMTFYPVGGYPANATITWRATLCGESYNGTFRTGTLFRPLDDVELAGKYEGVPYSFDTRVADWAAPVPMGPLAKDPVIGQRIKWRFGSAFLVEVQEVEDDALRVLFAPAVADSSGTYEQDLRLTTLELDLPLGDNPYVGYALDEWVLTANGQQITLRDVQVLMGMGRDGFEDVELFAEMDLRAYAVGHGETGCEMLEDLTGEACEPCQSDETVACTRLAIGGMDGLHTDAKPVRNLVLRPGAWGMPETGYLNAPERSPYVATIPTEHWNPDEVWPRPGLPDHIFPKAEAMMPRLNLSSPFDNYSEVNPFPWDRAPILPDDEDVEYEYEPLRPYAGELRPPSWNPYLTHPGYPSTDLPPLANDEVARDFDFAGVDGDVGVDATMVVPGDVTPPRVDLPDIDDDEEEVEYEILRPEVQELRHPDMNPYMGHPPGDRPSGSC